MRVFKAQLSERYYENYESLWNAIDTEETMQAPENSRTTIQAALREDYEAKYAGELRTHLKQLSDPFGTMCRQRKNQ